MIVDIPYKQGDDKKYLAAVCSLVATLVKEHKPKHLYVTRINKWFDHKWLRYSGMGRVAFYGSPLADTALDALWQDQLTFPPFNPKQIRQQLYWERESDGSYAGSGEPRWIHKRRLRQSADNLNYRVADFTESGIFVWFTSNTEKNMHGSILVYSVNAGETSAWYCSFKQEVGWAIDKVKGIDKAQVEKWFPIK
jgi:hypothetical protein